LAYCHKHHGHHRAGSKHRQPPAPAHLAIQRHGTSATAAAATPQRRRAEQHLVDAYQAEAISLAELSERRRSLAEQRRALEQQLAASEKLRREQFKARAVLEDLTAFCDRIRGRLDAASFADKQVLLQLVVERIIVHESSLEVHHVIPLRSPPPGRDGPADQPNGRLRLDRVALASLLIVLRNRKCLLNKVIETYGADVLGMA
jgi:site-specific DNA recombinase